MSCANVSCVLMCQRALYAFVPTGLACLHAQVSFVLMCSHTSMPCMLICSCANMFCVLLYPFTNLLLVLTCLMCQHACLTCLSTCVSTWLVSSCAHVPTFLESLFFSFTVIVVEVVHTVGKV